MGLKCPHCGGNVIYDAATQTMKCEFCDSIFDPEEFNVVNTGRKNKTVSSEALGEEEGLNIYTCRNCGATMMSHSNDLTIYCDYCGGEVILTNKADDSVRPQKIIPFTVSKRECTQAYESKIKKLKFVPPEFKDSGFLERFNGIYVPYYRSQTIYDSNAHAKFTSDKIVTHTSSRDTHREVKGSIDCHIQGNIKSLHDASSNLDDSLAEQVAPGQEAKVVAYNDSYLSGYYADLPDISQDTYKGDTKEAIQNAVEKQLKTQLFNEYGGTISLQPVKGHDIAEIKQTKTKNDILLAPIWFLTWKNRDKAAYAIVSGSNSNKSICDVPIDNQAVYKLSFILSAIFAVIILIVTAIVPIKPENVLSITAIIMTAMFAFFRREVQEIAYKENHVYDLGFAGITKMQDHERESIRVKKKKSQKNKGNSALTAVKVFLFIFFLQFAGIPVFAMLFISGMGKYAVPIVCLCISIFETLKTNHFAGVIEPKPGLYLRFLPVPLLATFLVILITTYNDLFYYLASIGGLGLTILFGINMINTYNYVVTRPLPGYHNGREGGLS